MQNSQKSSTNDSDCNSPLDTHSILAMFHNPNRMLYCQEEQSNEQKMTIIKEERRESSNFGSSFCSYQKRLGNSQDFQIEHSIGLQENQNFTQTSDKIIKIQSYVRMIKEKRKFKVIKKWAKYRRFVLQELVESELSYLKDLEIVIDQIIKPIEQQNLLNENEIQQVFRNIRSLFVLNTSFYKELQEQFDRYSHFVCFGRIIDKYVPFFKMYFEYSSNFSIECLSQLRQSNIQLDKFLQSKDEEDIYRGLNLESFLIKPVQRLPKYVLLLKDLIKHTWPSHPDYDNLERCLNSFKDVNKNIDSLIDKVLMNQMLFELQNQFFKNIQINIVESTRKFVQSETLGVLVSKQFSKSVIVHICTDLIIITQRKQNAFRKTQEHLFDYIYLDGQSFCKNFSETPFYKDLFTLCGHEKSITFVCDKEQKDRLIDLFENTLIQNLKQKEIQLRKQVKLQTIMMPLQINNTIEYQPIRVYAKGTQIRSTFLSKYTVYLMLVQYNIYQISVNQQSLTVSVRYKLLTQLEKTIQQDFPDLKIPHLSTKQWRTNKLAEVIEARKILIENFLETILNSSQVKENPSKVIQFLELPPSFYQMAIKNQCESILIEQIDSSEERNHSIFQQSKSLCLESDEQINNSKSLSQILRNANNNLRNSNIFRQTQHNIQLNQNISQSIRVYFMDGNYAQIPATTELRVSDLVRIAAEFIKLQCCDDFKLYMSDGKESRVLDDEDSFLQNHQDVKDNLLQKITIFFREKEKIEKRLILKKYVYLNQIQEKSDYLNDDVRLRLLTYQAYEEIKQENYYLKIQKYYKYAALYLIMKYYEFSRKIFTTQSLPIDKAKEFIPEQVYKSQHEKTWIKQIFDVFQKYSEKFKKQINSDKIHSVQWQRLAQIQLIKSITKQIPYGLQQFVVEIDSETKQIIKQQFKIDILQNVYLALSYQRLLLLSILNKSIIFSVKLVDILDSQFYAYHINFQVKHFANKLHFKTTNGFEIQRLYQIYVGIQTE